MPGTFGAPVPLVGDVKSSPIARGRMLRLERKKQGAESTVRAMTDMPGGIRTEDPPLGSALGYRWATRPAMCMEGQGYRVSAGEGRGWSASAAVGPPITLHKGGNGGSEGFEKVGPLVQVLGGGGGREGGTTCRVLSGPRFPWLATSSPPLPPGGGCSAWKERSREQTASSDRQLNCQGGFEPRTRHSAARWVTAGPRGQRCVWRARGIGLVQGRGEVGLPVRPWGRSLRCTRGGMGGARV